MQRLVASSVLVLLLTASLVALPIATAATTLPGETGCSRHTSANPRPDSWYNAELGVPSTVYDDTCFHQFMVNAPDTANIDVAIVPPPGAFGLRDANLVKQSVQMWEDGLQAGARVAGMGWLADGLQLHPYVVGVDVPSGASQVMPDIVVVLADASPYLFGYAFAGVGSDAPIATCRPITASTSPSDFPDAGELRSLPAFDGHHGNGWGTVDTSCANGARVCTVVGAVVQDGLSAAHTNNLYDLTSHEFGHCLGLGHVGDASDVPASLNYPPDDIMSYETDGRDPPHTLCVSNLNVKTIAYRYQPLIAGAPTLRYSDDGSGHIVMQGGSNPSAPDNDALADPLPASSWRIVRADGSLGTSAADCPQPDANLLPLPGSGTDPDPDPTTEPVLAITSPTDGAALDGGSFTVDGTVEHAATTGGSIGTQIVTDAAGDTQAGCDSSNPTAPSPCISAPNGSHDIVRLGGANDGSRLTFYVTVDDLAQFDTDQPFHLETSFAHTAVADGTGLYYSIKVGVTDAATAAPVGLYASGSVAGISAGPRIQTADVRASIVAPDTIALSVDLASIGNPVAGQQLTQVQATVTTPDTLDYFTVDATSAGSYTLGASSASTPALGHAAAGATLATNACSGTLPQDFLAGATTCSLTVPAGTATVELRYDTTYTGLFSAVVELFDPAGTSRAYSLDDCPAQPSGVGVTSSCDMASEGPVQAGTWTAEIYYQAGEVTEDYALSLVARGPVVEALQVDASGPYAGEVGAAIAVSATVQGGSPPVACSWSGAGATFAAPGACATTVTFASAGAKTVTVTASDAAGGSATDTATVDVSDGAGASERVELYDGTALVGWAPVSGGTSPEPWSIAVTLPGGEHTLTAFWFEEGAASTDPPLATDAITVTVTESDPCAGVTQAPALSNLAWSAGETTATLTWTTDAAATSSVDLGTTSSYGSTATSPGETTSHSVQLAGLAPGTTYHYRVSSNRCGFTASSVDNTFTTTGTPASVAITSPDGGAIVQAPVTFTGTFDTGDVGQTRSGTGQASAAAGSAAWATTVQGILASPAWQDLLHDLELRKGFHGAVPTLDGGATAFFDGKLPRLPATIAGFEVDAVRATPHTLAAPVDPDHVAFADRHAPADAVADWRSKAAAEPPGPATPGLPTGIGPGTAMLMGVDGVSQLCSLSYLLQDPSDPSQYYAATAGHCLLATGQGIDRTGAANPDQVYNHFELCYADCIDNALALGSYVVLTPTATYEPVAYASAAPVGAADAEGIGRDFGLLRIPKELNAMLRPWLPQFGGPDGLADALLGDLVVHYGHGSYCCPVTGSLSSRTPVDQGRVAVALGSYDDGSFEALGWITGGDSGSASGIGWIDGEKGVRGTDALGVNTHGIVSGVGYFDGTRLSKGQSMVQSFLGFTPQLVESADDIVFGGTESVVDIAFTSPAAGATVAAPGPVSLTGTATFPDGAGTGTQAPVTYFLHRPACGGAADVTTMDLVPAEAAEAGNGCGNLGATSMSEQWTATQDPGTTIPAGSSVVAHVRAFSLRPQVGVVMAGELLADGAPAGSGSSAPEDVVSVAAVSTPCTDFEIAFTTTRPIQATDDLVFAASTQAGTQDMPMCYEGGPDASRVAITPLGLPANTVQVSVDDAAFGPASLVPTTGSTSWSASWDLAGVAAGEHTLRARMLQDGAPVGPVATRTVTVQGDDGETGLRTQLRLSGPEGAGFDWTTIARHEGQASGSWSSTWDGPAAAGDYTLSARLMRDDDVLATSDVGFVVDHAPELAVPASAAASEGAAFDLVLTASDADGDALSYAVDGLPEGATLAGDRIQWTPSHEQSGGYDLTVTVSDGRLEDTAVVHVDVANTNRAPVLAPIPDQAVAERETLSFTVAASDPDGDAVTLAAQDLPTGATFDAASGRFTWTPAHKDGSKDGTTYRVAFTASDGSLEGLTTVSITVTKK